MKKDTKKLTFWQKLILHVSAFWYLDIMLLLTLAFLAHRLYHLLILPVFADEAIYIYWAQLAASDWSRYAFYPLNDGKTPLVIWLLIPLIRLCRDPLWAGRLLSILFGLAQMWLVVAMMQLFTNKTRYHFLSAILVILAPGLILNHRLALMDSASSFLVSWTFYGALRMLQLLQIKVAPQDETLRRRKVRRWAVAIGFGLGLSLWVKFSNILLLPVLATILLYNQDLLKFFDPKKGQTVRRLVFQEIILLCISSLIGLLLFATLRFSPAFSQLFSRGGDFLYSLSEFQADPGAIIAANLRLFILVMNNYCGPLIWWLALVLALCHFVYRRRAGALLLLLSGLAYALPIVLLGKVVYPRYFLPVIPFAIVSLCVSLDWLRRRDFFNFKAAVIILILISGGYYSYVLTHSPAAADLLPEDRIQLIEEWSAGYGIRETVALLKNLTHNGTVLVLTEGHIGTLPDGLQIYLWQDDDRNLLRIEGLGVPVRNFDAVADLFDQYDQVVLVVNSHRLELDDSLQPLELLAEYPRPDEIAPTLQVWRFK